MSTGAEHYREAERLLGKSIERNKGGDGLSDYDVDCLASQAQVHATLALAAATATAMVVHACEVEADHAGRGFDGPAPDEVTRREVDAWDDALGGERDE